MSIKKSVGYLLWVIIATMPCGPVTASATELSIQSDTIFRAFSRDTSAEKDAAVLPAYEYLQVDIVDPENTGLAFHLYGTGRQDLANSDYFTDSNEVELLYGYLEYSRKQARFNARLGRQYVFEGVANESIDGLRVSSDLGKYFSGSVYAGQQVALASESGRNGDSILGWRLANHLSGHYDLGLSYKFIRNNSENDEEMVGLDMSVYLPYSMNLFGSSAYNTLTNSWAEHSYELNAAIGSVAIRPYLQQFAYEAYFGTGSNSANPFRFLQDTAEELLVIGADLTIPAGENWAYLVKSKHYDYKIQQDSSLYFSAQATWSDDEFGQAGGELGMMSSDDAKNKYFLMRIFTYWDQVSAHLPISFISSDLIYVDYDQPIYGKESSYFASLGAGKKFMDKALELKLSADYSNDPYFDEDLRGMLTASYRFGKSL